MDIPVIVMLNKSRVTELLQGPTTGLLFPVPVTMATVLLTLRVPAVIQLLRVLSTTLLTDLDLMAPHLVLMVQDLMLVLLMALIRPPLITEGHHHMDHLIQDLATTTLDLLTALMASLNLPTILMVIWLALLTETLMLATVQIMGATLDTTEFEVTVL